MGTISNILPAKFFRAFVLLIFINYLANPSASQQLSSFQHFTFLSDFPQNTVQAIHQDSQGYIWVGTESGLNRYDGKRIQNYKLGFNDNFTLTGKSINNITEDEQHNLWIATNNGLSLFSPNGTPEKNKTLLAIADKINKSMASKNLECIKVLNNQKVVLGYRAGISIYNLLTGTVKALPTISYNGHQVEPFVVNIQEDIHRNIIAITNNHGVYLLDTGLQIIKHVLNESFKGKGNFALYNSVYLPGDKLIIASNQGLFKLDFKKWTLPQKIEDQQGLLLSLQQFNCIAYDPFKNAVLAGTNTSGVITLDTSGLVIDHLIDNKISKKLQSNNIFYLLVDKNGLGYWIGNGKGLIKFFYDEDRFSSNAIDDEEGSPMRIYPIYTENNINILIGTDRFLMQYNCNTRQIQKITMEDNLEVRYNYIYKAGKDLYIFCTKYGLYYSEDILHPHLKRISHKFPGLQFLDSANILCALMINDNQLLIGTRGINGGGMIRLNIKEKKADKFVNIENDNTSISNNTVNYITKSLKGDIIVCTNSGICYFDNTQSTFRRILLPGNNGISYPQVNAALAEQETLWIGTYGGGLNKYNNSTGKIEYITEKEGLASNDIYSIYRGTPDQLWMSTNQGIVLYNTRSGKIRNYDKADGLINNEFNRTSCFKLGDTLYFGGISGINYFNYKNIRENRLAPLADIPKISMLKSGTEKNLFPDSLNRLSLRYKENTLKFYLSSPYYINPGKTIFYYRLLPDQEEWISNGTNNELIFSQLPPGKHTLELKTINSEGVESSNTKSIHISITPPWYETTLFRILLLITIAGIIYTFYKLRFNQLKKEKKIRNQLAIDLHDDLGSTLNSVKVYSNLAMIEKGNQDHLLKIKESTQDAIAGVRDLIWVLDDKKDTIADLLARINLFAAPLCNANHIGFNQKMDDNISIDKLGKEEKRNLYMIMKESINNSIKYAECKNIILQADTVGKKISISLRDDGIGFDKEKTPEGNGLRNMKSRAKEIGYTITVDTSPGNGAGILLEKQ